MTNNDVIDQSRGEAGLKSAVREHWERETCGTRYGEAPARKAWFAELSAARYALEPYIHAFADFPSSRDREVLEIGVGAGADFSNWCNYAAHATGVDLTARGIQLTAERLQLEGVSTDRYTLRTADAENLPFDEGSFDLVYSWGVLHHTPDTFRAFAEAFRVLRPGGTLKAMIYHVPSWTGLLLQARYGWLRGDFRLTQKDALYRHLESPGTKAYSRVEARALVESAGFRNVSVATELAVGDLLTLKFSDKYRSPLFAVVRALYPRWLVATHFGRRWGLNLLVDARKPGD